MGNFSGEMLIIGAGNMGPALAKGFVDAGLVPAAQVTAYAPRAESRERFTTNIPGAKATDDLPSVAESADLIIIAVKPHYVPEVMAEMQRHLKKKPLVVSVAAGLTLSTLSQGLPKGTRIIRVMPNTPSLIGKGASGYSRGEHATEADAATVGELLAAVGVAVEVPEHLLDAVTGVSGSGPAYIYTVIEALADGGVRAGLPRDTALQLAAQTVSGAAEMVLTTGRHPAVLRDEVTSPGGTTAAGLAALEKNGLRWAMHEAVAATTNRAKELGGG